MALRMMVAGIVLRTDLSQRMDLSSGVLEYASANARTAVEAVLLPS